MCLHRRSSRSSGVSEGVRKEGGEPSRVSPPDPKSGASASSATFASGGRVHLTTRNEPNRDPGFGFLVLGSWFFVLVLRSWFFVLGSTFWVLRSGFPVEPSFRTKNSEPRTPNQERRTKNPEP